MEESEKKIENESESENNMTLTKEIYHGFRILIEKLLKIIVLAFAMCGLGFVAIAVICYINTWERLQYDYVATIEQTGVYTLIDSEGNVISADLDAEQIQKIMEVMNDGKDENNEEQTEERR